MEKKAKKITTTGDTTMVKKAKKITAPPPAAKATPASEGPQLPPPAEAAAPPPQRSPFVEAIESRVSDERRAVYTELYALVRMAAERHAAACLVAEGRGDPLPSFDGSGAAEVAAIAAKFGSEHRL
jgi:hypothetical protein